MNNPDPKKTIAAANLQPGGLDPWFGSRIDSITEVYDGRWAVWTTQKDYDVYWVFDENVYPVPPEGYSTTTARAARLEAMPVDHLRAETRRAFRALVAAGIAQMFNGDRDAAARVHDQAEEFILARLKEKARAWYVVTALVAASLLGVAMVLLVDLSSEAQRHAWLASATGAIGACFWLVARTSGFPADPNAGFSIHLLEAFARIGIGVLSGWLVLVASDTGVFESASLSGLLLAAFAAGATERFVPNLVTKVNGDRLAGSPGAPPPPQAATRNNGGDKAQTATLVDQVNAAKEALAGARKREREAETASREAEAKAREAELAVIDAASAEAESNTDASPDRARTNEQARARAADLAHQAVRLRQTAAMASKQADDAKRAAAQAHAEIGRLLDRIFPDAPR